MAWPITAGARGLQNNLCVRFSGERRLLACTPQSRESVAEDGGSYNAAIVS